jgi:hypothetical protein
LKNSTGLDNKTNVVGFVDFLILAWPPCCGSIDWLVICCRSSLTRRWSVNWLFLFAIAFLSVFQKANRDKIKLRKISTMRREDPQKLNIQWILLKKNDKLACRKRKRAKELVPYRLCFQGWSPRSRKIKPILEASLRPTIW